MIVLLIGCHSEHAEDTVSNFYIHGYDIHSYGGDLNDISYIGLISRWLFFR